MGRYVMVGLASRRILLHPSTEHMVAQVFRLQQAHGGETSMRVSALLVASLYGGSPRPGWQGNAGQGCGLPARTRDVMPIRSQEGLQSSLVMTSRPHFWKLWTIKRQGLSHTLNHELGPQRPERIFA